MWKEQEFRETTPHGKALYGPETARAKENFRVSGRGVRWELIDAMVTVKKASVLAYRSIGIFPPEKAEAMLFACDEILSRRADEAFVTDALQGGAGTSTHMNVNEVIAALAQRYLEKSYGSGRSIHPLDDVNRGQSTNDVYPTALRIAAIRLVRKLSDACAKLQEALQKKETAYETVRKLGRTELMDAVPVTLGQEFGAYAQAISRDRWRIYKAEERLRQINLGGTAVGTGSNAERKYIYGVTEFLRELTGIGLARAEYPMDITQNCDVFAEVSGLLKALAVNLVKICTDLRWMASGPNGGLGEIVLAPMQAGSTIMPGKVNPVIPEMVTQAAYKVIANDTAVTLAASAGNFELNAFLPLIADCLLESLSILCEATEALRVSCIERLSANPARCQEHLDRSAVWITALTPKIGYDRAAGFVRQADNDPERLKSILLQEGILAESDFQDLYQKRIGYRDAQSF